MGSRSKWEIIRRIPRFRSEWLSVDTLEIEMPSRGRFRQDVVVWPWDLAVAGVTRPDDHSLLLLRRHRPLAGTVGWELPGGIIESGETPVHAAVRETLEETGCSMVSAREIVSLTPSGLATQRAYVVLGHVGKMSTEPRDEHESDEVAFLDATQLAKLLDSGGVVDAITFAAVHLILRRGWLR